MFEFPQFTMFVAEVGEVGYGKMIKIGIGLIVLIFVVSSVVIARLLKRSALKHWAKARGLAFSPGSMTGTLDGYRLQITFTEHHHEGNRTEFRGVARVALNARLPDRLLISARKAPGTKLDQLITVPDDPEFLSALTVASADLEGTLRLLSDPNLRKVLMHFLTVAPGMEISRNSVNANIAGTIGSGGDVSPIFDAPLRRAGQLILVLEAALAGQLIEVDNVPGMNPKRHIKRLPTRK